MKKHFFYLAVTLSVISVGCNYKPTGPSAAVQRNLDTDKGIRDAIASKDLGKLDSYIAPDCIDHAGEHGDIKGLDSIKAQIQAWRAMADEKTEVIRELADEEYTMAWQRDRGKYTTTGYGHKAGDTFDLQAIEMVRYQDGKAVEHWTLMAPADVMKMMATTAAPATMDNAVIEEDSIRLKNKKTK